MRRVEELDENNVERFALGVMPRQAEQLHDGLDLLGEDAPPTIGFRLGRQDGVDYSLLVVAQESDETLVSYDPQ
jgi:hypothetical protein